VTAAAALLVFWLPPAGLAWFQIRWVRRQATTKGDIAGVILATALACVAWWFVLLGVVAGGIAGLSDVVDGQYHNAAVLGLLIGAWTTAMVVVVRRARRRTHVPYEAINLIALCAAGLAVPLVVLFFISGVI